MMQATQTDNCDAELRYDVLSSFEDAYREIESGLIQLLHNFTPKLVDQLFRSIHNVKGNAALISVEPIVDYSHSLENVFMKIREGKMAIDERLLEAIGVGMDRLKDLHHEQLLGATFENLNTIELAKHFNAIACAKTTEEKNKWISVILGVSQNSGNNSNQDPEGANDEDATLINLDTIMQSSLEGITEQQASDLEFFKSIATNLELQNRDWDGRTELTWKWAQQMNILAGLPVDSIQLAAACYSHDHGMAFTSFDLSSESRLTPSQREQISQHPRWSAGFIQRIPGWSEASEMILHHHEHENGAGYPEGISGDKIHPGAKIIAIIDAFFSMTNHRADRKSRRSAVRAASDINSRKGTQFSSEWVNIFNQVLKKSIRDGLI